MTLPNHDLLNPPRCRLCGSSNVREIGEEGTPEHKHVCMNKNCVEIASNRARIANNMDPLYPELVEGK